MTNFDEKAKDWDIEPRRVKLATAVAKCILESVDLDGSMQALEFGCGTGLVSMFLCEKVGSILAVDSSEGMIEQLNKKIENGQLKNVEAKAADICGDEIQGRFDLIYSSMVMHHIEDYKVVLGKLHKLTRSGGYLAVADLDYEGGEFHKDTKVWHNGFHREEFVEALKEAGYEPLEDKTAFTFEPSPEKGNREFTVFLITAVKR